MPAVIDYRYRKRDLFGKKIAIPYRITLTALPPIDIETIRAKSAGELRDMTKGIMSAALDKIRTERTA